jgi:hypothetical protein
MHSVAGPMSGVGASRRLRIMSVAGPWLVTAVLFVAVIVTGAEALAPGPMDLATLAFLYVSGSWGLVLATVGALIAFRRPENRIGRLLQISGLLIASCFLGFTVAADPSASPGPADPVAGIAGWWASTTIFLAIFLAFPVLGILYPDGRLPGRRWRLPILILVLVQLATGLMYAVKAGPVGSDLPDNPFGLVDVPPGIRDALESLAMLSLVVGMGFAIVAIAIRWRRGNLVERSQLKWLFAALVVAGITVPLTSAASQGGPPSVVATLGVGSALLIPIAVGIAILRYRLYDIDRLVSRTVSWAVVTGVLVAVFAGVVVALQAALAGATQGETLAVAASTLVAFALFQPVRRRVQSAVDHRFDRARYDAQRTVDAFAEHLRNEVDLATLRTALIATADDAVRPVSTTVWLRGGPEAST